MKKLLALLMVLVLAFALVACGESGNNGGNTEPSNNTPSGGESSEPASNEKKKILFYTAFIGDFGLSDMGYRAVQEVAEKYDMEWTLVEYGAYDAALAVNSFWDALETTEYDYFLGPTWYIEDLIDEAAAAYPNTNFIYYDVGKGVEWTAQNAWGITFAQNESSFLAAILQALMTKTGKIGCLSSDSPIMNDFNTGWLAGVKYARKEMGLDVTPLFSYLSEVAMSSVYEAQNVMYDNGCDAVWAITAQMMLASCQAAEEHGGIENGYFVMGCDYDQWEYFKGVAAEDSSSAVGYENIITSITKNIGPIAIDIVESIESGNPYPAGNAVYGAYENGVGYLENDNFKQWVPEDVQATLKDLIQKIGSGEIKVPSYYDFNSYEAFEAYRDNVDADFAA